MAVVWKGLSLVECSHGFCGGLGRGGGVIGGLEDPWPGGALCPGT